MSFRTVLANLNEARNNQSMMRTAALLASEFDASVTGLYVIPATPVSPQARYEPIPEMFEAHRTYFKRRSASVEAAFKASFPGSSARYRMRIENSPSPLIGDSVIEQGRSFDLIVVSKTETALELGIELNFVPCVAVAAGRPVLVIPFNTPMTSFPETVLIGWNGSREAARAVFDSLPLLKRAKTVHLIWVDPPPAERTRLEASPDDGISQALALHGIKVVTAAINGKGQNTGDVLLREAAALGADLLIIGAYGHSRLSEFVLGGVTRTVLRDMTCPVLLSH